MDLSGNWQGFYEYGLGYELPFFGQRVTFKTTITDINGSFTGEIEEDNSEFSVQLKSSIKGFVKDDFISFVKKYSDSNSEENDLLEVEYEGFIDEKNQSIYGNWLIREVMTDENLGTFEYTTEGIWLLSRV